MTAMALTAGCFPNDPYASRIAKISEGGAALLGIGFLGLAKTQADCDANSDKDMGCNSTGSTLQTVGLSLLIVGIVGFIATVSVEEDAKPKKN